MQVNHILRQVSKAVVRYSEENSVQVCNPTEILILGSFQGNPLRVHTLEVNKNYIDVRATLQEQVGTQEIGLVEQATVLQCRVAPAEVELACNTLLQGLCT